MVYYTILNYAILHRILIDLDFTAFYDGVKSRSNQKIDLIMIDEHLVLLNELFSVPGPYFSAVDLATIARDLDQVEQSNLDPPNGAEASNNSGGQSENYDDSGYFSVQVIQRALEFWGLTLVVAGSSHAVDVIGEPTSVLKFTLDQNSDTANWRPHRNFQRFH